MEKYLLRKEADAARGSHRIKNKIITNEMIAIFMAFLTYGKDKRRDFLRYDMSIEEEFQAEVENRPAVITIDESMMRASTLDYSLNSSQEPSFLLIQNPKRISVLPGVIQTIAKREEMKRDIMSSVEEDAWRNIKKNVMGPS